jgi:hypothetical protein
MLGNETVTAFSAVKIPAARDVRGCDKLSLMESH